MSENIKDPIIFKEGEEVETVKKLKNKLVALSPEDKIAVGKSLNEQFAHLSVIKPELYKKMMAIIQAQKELSSEPDKTSLQELLGYIQAPSASTMPPKAPNQNATTPVKPAETVTKPAEAPFEAKPEINNLLIKM